MVQQIFMNWSNWNWSKEYTLFGPTDNHLDQSKVQVIWSKEYINPVGKLFSLIGFW